MRLLRDQRNYIFAYTSKGPTQELATLLHIYYTPHTILDVCGGVRGGCSEEFVQINKLRVLLRLDLVA